MYDAKTEAMMREIASWPEWKKKSICVDDSDIELLQKIESHLNDGV